MAAERQAQIIGDMDEERAADILEHMSPDEAADVLGDLPEDKAEDLLNLMEDDEQLEVAELLPYADDTAGGLMTTEFVTLPRDLTVGEALARLREMAKTPNMIYYLYVVTSEGSWQLEGVIALRSLILADPGAPLSEVMRSEFQIARTEVRGAGRHLLRRGARGVRRTVARRRRFLTYLAILGPGMITANDGNDAGGIATYASVGADHGYRRLWILIPITVSLGIVQE